MQFQQLFRGRFLLSLMPSSLLVLGRPLRFAALPRTVAQSLLRLEALLVARPGVEVKSVLGIVLELKFEYNKTVYKSRISMLDLLRYNYV